MINKHYSGQTAGTTGAISELKVCVDLMAKGYHIFRSESPCCPCDLVALKNGITLTVEVRTIARNPSGTIPQSAYRVSEQGVVNCFAFVFKDNGEDIVYHSSVGVAIDM